ncbi:hypothetical protein DEI82_08275 [Curtobacterium sp. MCBD17_019]|nr:hypothetical protein DEI82_08275 [Curtobacterium sp. MCBD17_019]
MSNAGMTRKLDALGLSMSSVSWFMSELLARSVDWTDRQDVGKSIVALLKSQFQSSSPKLVRTLGNRFRSAAEEDWQSWSHAITHATTPIPAAKHIHAVKGGEFEAVLLDIPSRARAGEEHVLDTWVNGRSSESLRVFYVGASRARALLVLAVAERQLATLERGLSEASVPYVVLSS